MSSAILAERLKDLLLFAEINESQLSKATNIALKSIHNWLREITYPNPESLLIIADYFKVTTDYILGLSDEYKVKTYEKTITIEVAQKILVEYLNEYVNNRGITQHRLARELKTGQSGVKRWFEVGAMPETETLIKISELLEKPLDELLGRK